MKDSKNSYLDSELQYRFTSWLKNVLKNTKLMYLRKEMRHRLRNVSLESYDDNTFSYEMSEAREMDFYFENEKLFIAYKKMDANWRKVLMLLFIENKTVDEVVQELKISKEFVWKIKSLALKRLREAMEETDE